MTTRIEWDNKIPRSHEVFDQLFWPRVFPISLSVRCALCTSLPYFEWAPSKHLRSLHPLTHATTLKHTRAFESHVAYAQVIGPMHRLYTQTTKAGILNQQLGPTHPTLLFTDQMLMTYSNRSRSSDPVLKRLIHCKYTCIQRRQRNYPTSPIFETDDCDVS